MCICLTLSFHLSGLDVLSLLYSLLDFLAASSELSEGKEACKLLKKNLMKCRVDHLQACNPFTRQAMLTRVLSTVSENNLTSSNNQNIMRPLLFTTPELSKANRWTWEKRDRDKKTEPSITPSNTGQRAESHGPKVTGGLRVAPGYCLILPFTYRAPWFCTTASPPYCGTRSRCCDLSC